MDNDKLWVLSVGSSVALEVLDKLFEVEKTLKNEKFQFNQEAKAMLREVAEAVKKLEYMRKTTIELLEIESIEINRLRFLLWHLPGKITKEIEDAVLAARKTNADEIIRLRLAIKKIIYEIELMTKRLSLLEKVCSDLRKDQEEICDDHKSNVILLNAKMKEKAENDVRTQEIYDQIKAEEEEIAYYQNAIKKLMDSLNEEKMEFQEKKQSLEQLIYEIEKDKEEEVKQNILKKKELATMMAKIKDIKKEVTRRAEVKTEQAVEKENLEGGMKNLQEQYEEDLKQPEFLKKKMHEYEDRLTKIVEMYKADQADLLKKIKLANEKLSSVKIQNNDLHLKNKLLTDQLKSVQVEERNFYLAHITAQEIVDRIEETILEKKAFLNKRVTDTKALEEGIDNLRNLYLSTVESYRKQIDFMKGNWIRESQRSVITQWKIFHLRKKHEVWKKEQESNIQDIIFRIEEVEKKRAEIYKESITYETTATKQEEMIVELYEEIKEEEKMFSKLEEDVYETLKVMEEKYNIEEEITKEKEAELETYVPKVKMIEETYEENVKEFEELKHHVTEKTQEQQSLKHGITMMKKEAILFETDKAITDLKVIIDDMRDEGKNILEITAQNTIDLAEYEEKYDTKWEELLDSIQMFDDENQYTLNDMMRLVGKLCQRDDKLTVICLWLEKHIANLSYIIDYKDSKTSIKKKSRKKKVSVQNIVKKSTKIQ
ncbi:coiled-coil domain-containing protein 175 isoform X2 [Monodelphis domestica]|uniref:coiled-coil domain-containing protein 175 isoform X2 n=1 Tax=Monodelphis domestica TaxID=13616 RepID=UPI0024E20A64|nr:coiled-coil domain-containing protein 175 isoform X2 [Monodelphis domestica]